MKSSPWRREKALYFRGFPLRPLGWSLLLHGLVLAALLPFVPDRPRAALPAVVLRGELQPLPAVGPAATSAEPSPPGAPLSPRTSSPPQMARPEPASAVPPAPRFQQEAPVPFQTAEAGSTAPAAEPAANAATRSGASGGEVAAAAAPPPSTAAVRRESDERGPDLGALRQFRIAVALEARRFRRYPDLARRAGQAGTVEVRLAVAAGGRLRTVELGRSSGNATLDAAALDMMRQAVQRAILPDALRERDFTLLLPVLFEIEE